MRRFGFGVLFLLLVTAAYSLANPPSEKYRVTVIEGVSPENVDNYKMLPHSTVQPIVSGAVSLNTPFIIKSKDGGVKGTLRRLENGALHFKGNAFVKTCGSNFDASLPVGQKDFIPSGVVFSGAIFDFYVRFEPEN